jgi:hypothetical protein
MRLWATAGWHTRSLRVIAAGLGRSPSTVSREVASNGGRHRYQTNSSSARATDQHAIPSAMVFTRASACSLGNDGTWWPGWLDTDDWRRDPAVSA